MSDTRKCLHCGGDAVEEGFAHCSAECLLNSTHDTADKIVEEVTTSLSGLYENSSAWAPGDKYGWRFYEAEKRLEELEVAVLGLRRFMIFLNACVFASFIVLLTMVI